MWVRPFAAFVASQLTLMNSHEAAEKALMTSQEKSHVSCRRGALLTLSKIHGCEVGIESKSFKEETFAFKAGLTTSRISSKSLLTIFSAWTSRIALEAMVHLTQVPKSYCFRLASKSILFGENRSGSARALSFPAGAGRTNNRRGGGPVVMQFHGEELSRMPKPCQNSNSPDFSKEKHAKTKQFPQPKMWPTPFNSAHKWKWFVDFWQLPCATEYFIHERVVCKKKNKSLQGRKLMA